MVEVQRARARRVEVAVLELPGDIDGLLGLSFLSRFSFRVDYDRGELELASRQ